MKIREMLLTLVKSGQDFSDHGMFVRSTDGEMGPMHGEDCAFCDAWRAALWLLSERSPHLQDLHEVGDLVTVVDRHPGVVEKVIILYRVRLGGVAVGDFAPKFVKAAESRALYLDRAGDTWEHDTATGKALLVDYADGTPVVGTAEDLEHLRTNPPVWHYTLDQVEKRWGPLTRKASRA